MSTHPGMSPDRSGSNAFFSDANLNLRARPASYADFAPLPGEAMHEAVKSSPALQQIIAAGGAATPLQLAEIEVDDGGRSADMSVQAAPMASQSAAPPQSDSLDQLADLLIDRIQRKLSGGQ